VGGCEGRGAESHVARVGVELGGVCGLAKGRCSHPPLVSCNCCCFLLDMARHSRAREKKD
jgi:hypothetical protein